jgi:hypothetical protein
MGNEVMTGIPVSDFEPAAEFYVRLLGRAPDVVAVEGREVLWQVRDLAWIYGGRKATVTDPDGNSIAFVEVP